MITPTANPGYLRDRPFLIVDIYQVPNPRVRTNRKGWLNDPTNVTDKEHPTVVTRITDHHLRQASVIIDLLNDRVIKNRLVFDNVVVLSQYKNKYADLISRYGQSISL